MSFVDSTEKFLNSAEWLTDSDAPAVMGLRAAAQELDIELSAALLGQYRLLYAGLLKRQPALPVQVDPVAALIDQARSGGR